MLVKLKDALIGTFTDNKQVAVAVQIYFLRLIRARSIVRDSRTCNRLLYCKIRSKNNNLFRTIVSNIYASIFSYRDTRWFSQITFTENCNITGIQRINHNSSITAVCNIKVSSVQEHIFGRIKANLRQIGSCRQICIHCRDVF